MNQGHWIRALLFSVTAVTTDRGAIQSARASLIVVPTANAVGPYFDYRTGVVNRQRGPQPKLRLAHMPTANPIIGNSKSAAEFRIKTVPSEAAISSSLASAIGPTAALAFPPQIAVPALIKNDDLLVHF